ncbi:polysaccharide deacetylase family protein [Colletotrichum salicis]|uniref:Polysaccharide deacetylase family protein n=1 Tax=Colletotrichum salicis TaxID=1209931 RepID=A0A135TED5_9PEZI|nr:polysaccharide deacetylase family protein [Colletotrichum salicis]
MGRKRVLISYDVDVDAVSGWLGSYGGDNSPNDISRGIFAGTVGTQRMLKLLEKYNIKTTWFIPSHSLGTFPDDLAAVRDAGHEIGLHGYSHENPTDMTIEQRDVLDMTYRMLTDFCGGKPPRGSVAPCMAHHGCQACFLNTGESWTKIDYSQKAETWMKPLVRGKDTGLVEIPSNCHVFVNVRDFEDIWRDHFDYFYREYDEFIFPISCHPDVSGRPHAILMHERLIEHFKSREGVEFVTTAEMADEFRLKNTPAPGALMPAASGLMLRK